MINYLLGLLRNLLENKELSTKYVANQFLGNNTQCCQLLQIHKTILMIEFFF